MSEVTTLHGTVLALGSAGVLLLGPPGAGKSDLALRLLDQAGHGLGPLPMPAELVSDDQALVVRVGESLIASPPAALAGLIEVRGLGILKVSHRGSVRLTLAVRLTDAATVDRMPDLAKSNYLLLNAALPMVLIDPRQPSAAARVRAAVSALPQLLEGIGACLDRG